MNFGFDFHQFLLLFIDIVKTLESVATLSSYLKANTEGRQGLFDINYEYIFSTNI